MPGIDFSELRRRISIADVLSLLRFEATTSRGRSLRGPCPIHGSTSTRNRDFSVDLDTNCFRCFNCGKAGNQLDLWVFTQAIQLHPAAIDLCQRLGTDVPWT